MNSRAEREHESAVEPAQVAVIRPRLLVCVDWFDPGVRAGGPIRSCANLAVLLGKSADVAIITSDRDLGSDQSYDAVPSDRWFNWRGLARVRYCSSGFRRCAAFVFMLRRFRPHAVYLNSMFSLAGTLWPLLWLRLTRRRIRIFLAPRGMLKPAAMQQKGWKKRPLIWFLRTCGVLRHVSFHATSPEEAAEIHAAFGAVPVTAIPNVPCLPVSKLSDRTEKACPARFCSVGRVHETKNILWLIELSGRVQGDCQLTIVGPVEDTTYHQRCLNAVRELPESVRVEFVGAKSESEVREFLIQADAMILPTLGENFGHAIFESLAVGTPVIISDRTMWRDLQARNAGWDLSLDAPDQFVSAMNAIIGMNHPEYRRLQQGALSLAHEFFEQHNLLSGYTNMFFGVAPPAARAAVP